MEASGGRTDPMKVFDKHVFRSYMLIKMFTFAELSAYI